MSYYRLMPPTHREEPEPQHRGFDSTCFALAITLNIMSAVWLHSWVSGAAIALIVLMALSVLCFAIIWAACAMSRRDDDE